MRTLRLISALILFSAVSGNASDRKSAATLPSLPAAAQANISAALGRDSAEFYARPVAGGFEASSGGLATRFTPAGVEVTSGSARWGLRLSGYGYGDALLRVTSVAPHSTKNRVEYRRGKVTEWYVNGPAGLEQGFTIHERPAKANGQPLTIALETSGNLTAAAQNSGTSLNLVGRDGEELLRYTGLTASDADGKNLRAILRVQGQQLLLQVDDRGARYPVVVDPVVQLAKLTASDGKAEDNLGSSIAISDNVIVVGASGKISHFGAVYVFVRPPSGWKDMTQVAELTAAGGESGSYFGASLAFNGNMIVVGAYGANRSQGAAYVFVKPPHGWKNMTETAKLVASDGAAGDYFGVSVALSADTVVVGASGAVINGNFSQGAAYLFGKPPVGWVSRDAATLTETAKLTASDGTVYTGFGLGMSISGNTLVVGSAVIPGEAYVFVKPASGWTDMTETAQLKSSDGAILFSAIATNGSTVVAGEAGFGQTGRVYVFVEPSNGWADVTEAAQLGPQTGFFWSFGHSVAIDGTGHVIAVGAPNGNGHKIGAGDVFVYMEPPTGWQTTSQFKYRLFASDGQFSDSFGTSVSFSGKTLVAGAPGAQIGPNRVQGAAYVFGAQ